MDHNMVGWFEVPVTDMERAKTFYECVFNIEISVHNLGGVSMGWFIQTVVFNARTIY